ncbi:unnamed protein product [Clonostachys solani]|uniref:Uncharacterized protein n=1 Tax=Clonostachys solani TaxID=160281 RepID=A0A9N9YZN5_9HYPO|nr:unnamed protein product [Clonostachys solani]
MAGFPSGIDQSQLTYCQRQIKTRGIQKDPREVCSSLSQPRPTTGYRDCLRSEDGSGAPVSRT